MVFSMCVKLLFVATFLLAVAGGCAVDSDETFTLPPGDAERGKTDFVAFRCFDCHRINGVDLPVGEEPNQAIVELGGEVQRVKNYGELVTAIINPSHRLARGYTPSLVAQDGHSRMTVYNAYELSHYPEYTTP
jgi:hypothetical protein